jgi:predicted DNA-binding protein YlxM (UPF0122 family)
MSYLSEKFNVPETTIKNMIRSGVISCTWEGYEEVISLYKQGKSLSEIAIETNRSKTSVHGIIQRFKKS